MKMKLKIRNRSHGYDINRDRHRHECKYTKYKKCLSMMVLTYIKQHSSHIGSSIHERVKQQLDRAEKNFAYEKKLYFSIIFKTFQLLTFRSFHRKYFLMPQNETAWLKLQE